MSQKIYSNLDIKGNAKIGDITNATSDTDKFLVSDAGVVKYRTGSEMLSDLGVAPGVASNIQHQVKAGVAINKGQAVYVTGADGTNMIVGLASNASEATSSKTMGLMASTVATNGFGNVIAEGLLAGLDTSTANAGDPVWLGTGGNLIYGLINKPYAPNH
jgi:GTPase